jgi:hypothetical protein
LHDPLSIIITLPLFAAVVVVALRVPDDVIVTHIRRARRRGHVPLSYVMPNASSSVVEEA